MESKWRKAKIALGLKLCAYVPRISDDASSTNNSSNRLLESSVSSGNPTVKSTITAPSAIASSGFRLLKSSGRSSRKFCAICLGAMKPGNGLAIFTAECSHAFHFHCIASNVKHGNRICPVCRAKWKEIPFKACVPDPHYGRIQNNPVNPPHDARMTLLRRLPPPRTSSNLQHSSMFQTAEPNVFNDDEPLNSMPVSIEEISPSKVLIRTYPEFSSIAQTESREQFTVLVHLKAPMVCGNASNVSGTSRVPVDLVTVLDVSGSMAGTKLALLKRAMSFVIQHLGPSDRLSVIAFSSTASRLFHLLRMSESGRQQALQAINSLTASGGTNITEGLRKALKVMNDRKEKNPVNSIILLSDGQDTYSIMNNSMNKTQHRSFLPQPVCNIACQIPVHAFGFGADHDADSMHSISETSGGTFSFIETESVIQDAFAQCIGGLLSVVVQDLKLGIESVNTDSRIDSIKSGNYTNQISDDHTTACIEVGNLYADEERDFLVTVNVSKGKNNSLLKVSSSYIDPLSKETVSVESEELRVERPQIAASDCEISIEVKRQKNRVEATEAMAKARNMAEHGDLPGAVAILESCRKYLFESLSGKTIDLLSTSLDMELKEMQERMASRRVYELSGRAYMLSGLSSHSWQRATARGDSTESTSFVRTYQTPSMIDMLTRSQTFIPSLNDSSPVGQARSFPVKSQPR